MIAAYVRVSSKSQELATQRDAIARACKARGDSIDMVFEEKVTGVSERPELRSLRNFVRGGRFSKVYVYRLDRLSRGTICEMLNLLNEFKTAGCQVISVGDDFPVDGPFGEFVVAAIAMCAAMERNAIQERVAAARLRVESSGGSWGRPRKLTPEHLERIQLMKSKGRSVRYIAKELKIPVSTVHDNISAKVSGKPPPQNKKKSRPKIGINPPSAAANG